MTEEKKFRFGFDDLALTVETIENVIGYNEGDDRQFMASMISDVLADCRKIAEVRSQYRVFNDVNAGQQDKTFLIGNTVFHIDKIVYAQIRKSERAALFICTAGPEIGNKSRQLMNERDLLTGYLYDVVGSEVVEAAADLMQGDIEQEAARSGLKITNRYSPGYCGWDVAEQHRLFSFFPDNYCRISLTASALMDPVKSVSGIIGIGENVKRNSYTCTMCDMDDCIYRRLREKKKR